MGGTRAFTRVGPALTAPPPIDPSIAINQAQQDLLKKQRLASTNATGAAGLQGKANLSARTLLGA